MYATTEPNSRIALLTGDLSLAAGLQTELRKTGTSLEWCATVRDVAEGLEGGHPPAVLVVDVPRRSRRMVRELEQLARRVTVVALATPSDKQLTSRCLDAGAWRVFPRNPWARRAVASCLATLAENRRLVADLQRSSDEAREAHLQLVRVLEHCAEGAVVAREDGTALFANQAARWGPRLPARTELRLVWRGEPAILSFLGSVRPAPTPPPREAAAVH